MTLLYFVLGAGDVLLFAGDAGIGGEQDAALFDAWLGNLPHRHKVVTFGNMDLFGPCLARRQSEFLMATKGSAVHGVGAAAKASIHSLRSESGDDPCLQQEAEQGSGPARVPGARGAFVNATCVADAVVEVAGFRCVAQQQGRECFYIACPILRCMMYGAIRSEQWACCTQIIILYWHASRI